MLTRGNLAIAAGRGDATITQAGGTLTDIGNVALSLGRGETEGQAVVAGDIAQRNPSYFNLAASLGEENNVQAVGLLNSVINVGHRNGVSAFGVFNNATSILGDDNEVIAANVPEAEANILQRIGANVAFNAFGNGNVVHAGFPAGVTPGGPLAIAGALGVDEDSSSQGGPGITIRNPFSPPANTANVLAASNPNKFTPTALANRSTDRTGSQASGSLTTKKLTDSLNQATSSLTKKVNDNVQKAVNKLGKNKKQTDKPETGSES